MSEKPQGTSGELDLLYEASRLLGTLNLNQVLASIIALASRAIPVDAYSIWRRKSDGSWSPVLSQGLSDTYLRAAANTPSGLMPQTPLVMHELGSDPQLEARHALYVAEGIKALAVIPLRIRDAIDGTLVFYCRSSRRFSDADLKLASTIANLAGAAITSSDVYEEQRQLLLDKEASQEKTAFLAEASRVLASSLDYETTLGAIARLSAGFMADWCTVDMAAGGDGAPHRLATAHVDPARVSWAQEFRRRYPAEGNDPAARVIQTGKPILIERMDDALLVAGARDETHLRLLRELSPVSFMCAPMCVRGRTLGAVSFLSAESGREYTQADLRFAEDLCSRCALAIDNSLLYKEARENAQREAESRSEVETLNRVGRLLSAELNLEKLVQSVTDAATELTGAQFGSFFYNVMNASGESYMLYTISGVPRERFSSFPMPRATALFGPTFRGEGIVRVANVREDPRYGHSAPYHGMPAGHLPVASYLAVPVSSRSGEVIGGLFFGHAQVNVFTERHERIVSGLAAQTAIAMENALLLGSVQKARAEASQAHEQLSNILESTSDAFMGVDSEWRITHVNARAEAMTGISRADLMGKDVRELLSNTPGGRALAELMRATETRNPVQFQEQLAPSERWIEVSAYPTRFGLAVFGRDITEKRRFEDQLRQTAKLESLGVLAGGVAHDFNNILVGILGNSSLALESISPSSPVREILQDVVTATERAATLTRQLLAYAGKGRFVIQPLNLSELLTEIRALLQTSIPRSVQLRVDLAADLPAVQGDGTQIQQLLMNLIINAAEAMGENETGTVLVTTGVQDVDEQYISQILAPFEVEPGRYVCVEVSDTGCGMDAETIARIFDPFFTTKFTGRGLGLAAAMGIVRGHKGALKVYSTPGKGSTFKVLFPATNEAAPKAAEPRKETASGSGLILIVDDEEIVRKTTKKTLERYGYQVLLAEDGQEGVKLFASIADKVSLVILDLTMPVMGGEEALRQLKTIRPNVPVLLSSGFSEVEAVQRFAGKGLSGFLQKPYTAAALGTAVKEALA